MKKSVGLIALLVFAVFAASQDKPAQKKSGEMKHEHAAMENKGGPPPVKPGPEITKLIKMFSGNWTVAESVEPSPMAPKGASGTGRATYKPGPGGLSLIEDYDSPHGSMGPFHGHGLIWWDAKAGMFKGTWCDSMMTDCMVSSMKWQGDKLVADPYPMDEGGQKMVMTSQYSEFKPDSITFEMGMGPTAEQAKKTMTLVYKRAGKAAVPAAKKEATPAKQ